MSKSPTDTLRSFWWASNFGVQSQTARVNDLVPTASRDGAVRLWEACTGKERQVLRGHEFGVSFSAQGDRLVSASAENTLLVWREER